MSLIEDYKIITITHRNLNVDELGNFVINYNDKAQLADKLHAVKDQMDIQEIIYLSTCNRISFILHTSKLIDADFIETFFLEINPFIDLNKLKRVHKFADIYNGVDAVRHLFEVASSMDSLVVGEREIFRQFRAAYDFSWKNGLVGDNLRLIERFTVNTAKSVYANTKIGEKPLSVVSLAVKSMLEHNLADDTRILMVGAGETNTLVGKFLKKHTFNNISIFNRSLDNASELSEMLNADAYHLSELKDYDKGFDVLIVCTGSTEPVVTLPIYKNLIADSQNSKKVVVDLSVPANVASEVVSSFEMEYIDVESLRSIAQENLEFRKQEVVAARVIIEEKLNEFSAAYQQRQLEIALKNVPKEIKKVKTTAFDVYKKQLENLDPETVSLIDEMMSYMEKKCISLPMQAAKAVVNV